MEYDLIRLWLGMISDMGNAALGRILDYFGGPEELWNVPEHVLRETLTEKQSERILCTRDEKKIIVYKNRLKERNIYIQDILISRKSCGKFRIVRFCCMQRGVWRRLKQTEPV